MSYSESFSLTRHRELSSSRVENCSSSVNQVLYEQGDKIDFVYFPLDSVVPAGNHGRWDYHRNLDGRPRRAGRDVDNPGKWTFATMDLGDGQRQRGSTRVEVFGKAVCPQRDRSQSPAPLLSITDYTSVTALRLQYQAHDHGTAVLLVADGSRSRRRNNLNLTQEMIASRVGARRAGITVAAGMLQEMKAIEYRRGQLYIRDREVLERTVCECYTIMRS